MTDPTDDHWTDDDSTGDETDGCDLDFGVEAMPDTEAELFVLFAEALDPATPTTVDDVATDWKELFG